jgi:hypothetical protein
MLPEIGVWRAGRPLALLFKFVIVGNYSGKPGRV